MGNSKMLVAEKQIEIRFSEVDIMNVVWHGSYPLYLEDAREAFGAKYGLSYQKYIDEKVFAPIVKMDVQYRTPLRYGMKPIVRITYIPTDSAKVLFEYEIVDPEKGTVFITAQTTQVFMDTDYNLLWYCPPFYEEWKKHWGQI